MKRKFQIPPILEDMRNVQDHPEWTDQTHPHLAELMKFRVEQPMAWMDRLYKMESQWLRLQEKHSPSESRSKENEPEVVDQGSERLTELIDEVLEGCK